MEKHGLYSRNGGILDRKFLHYFLPTLITTIAISLNEFVDSLVVSNLLGSDALSIVNLGSPIVLAMAAVYTLFGNGGATVYGVLCGKQDRKSAGQVFRLSMLVSIAVGALFLVLGMIFLSPLCNMLCRTEELIGDFTRYVRILILSSPLLIGILSFVEFLPPSGSPVIAMVINLTANVVNLVFDYIYIRIVGLGVAGAALATATGYAVALVLLVVFLIMRRLNVHPSPLDKKASGKNLRMLGNIAATGSSPALIQAGYSIKFAFCNAMAIKYGGTTGIAVFSLCIQLTSLVSIALAAISGAAAPLMSVLHGQRDYEGESLILKTAMRYCLVSSVVFVALFELFPGTIASLYNVTENQAVTMANVALRVFALMFLFRSLVIIFMDYLKVKGINTYAMGISLFDGFAGIIPICWVLCTLFGLNGLWWTFAIDSMLLFAIVLVINSVIVHRSKGKYKGILLEQQETAARRVWDMTIPETSETTSKLSQELIEECTAMGMDEKTANSVGLVVEEMAVYTAEHSKSDRIDILIKLFRDKILIDFRSLGTSSSPLVKQSDDNPENISILKGFSSKIEYDYLLGMNTTRIIIDLK